MIMYSVQYTDPYDFWKHVLPCMRDLEILFSPYQSKELEITFPMKYRTADRYQLIWYPDIIYIVSNKAIVLWMPGWRIYNIKR